ncbi:unnamed protein product [Spirodela intermedia]|uniref:Integrase zinc-binding domain-containing protein n=1 Tax=Spirodela intermedia TaxID=51605 RepID=A0A7I8JJF2_SPIIN|nr:unnamed protein product [Spirodela intermedia]CAA6670284.1 unnamed protein product [Spirodela intermedia]
MADALSRRVNLLNLVKDFLLVNGCLFFRRRLCVPHTSLRDFLTWECHAGGLLSHFGRNKTIAAIEYQFYWPTLKRDVGNIIAQCQVLPIISRPTVPLA